MQLTSAETLQVKLKTWVERGATGSHSKAALQEQKLFLWPQFIHSTRVRVEIMKTPPTKRRKGKMTRWFAFTQCSAIWHRHETLKRRLFIGFSYCKYGSCSCLPVNWKKRKRKKIVVTAVFMLLFTFDSFSSPLRVSKKGAATKLGNFHLVRLDSNFVHLVD